VVDNNIIVGGRTLSESGACCLSGATGQTTDGTTTAVASTRRSSKEECYRDTQTKASEVEAKGGLFICLFKLLTSILLLIYRQPSYIHIQQRIVTFTSHSIEQKSR